MMQANWSLILNVLLLVGVVIAIVRTLRARRQAMPTLQKQSVAQPSIGQSETPHHDDIIAVRKVQREVDAAQPIIQATPYATKTHQPARPSPVKRTMTSASPVLGHQEIVHAVQPEVHVEHKAPETRSSDAPVMMFLLAKENRQLAGYELLQTVLAAGLRFGEGQLFHRHQYPNGQGPVLCSLAAATATGVFDLQNIGAFVVRGLCLFMQASGNPTIDAERFEIMLDTAKQLSEGLDTYLLDERRKPLSDASVERYHQRLKLDELELVGG